MKAAVRLIAGMTVLLLVAGCALLPAASGGSARRVTILYTGYGRGVLDPQVTDCG